ncbi:MAG: carbohydrate esterase [Pseudomonadales bacterium]|nr:carbohydrate esterase [Pseudomonadales bacterium]
MFQASLKVSILVLVVILGIFVAIKAHKSYSKQQERKAYRQMQHTVAERMVAGHYYNAELDLQMPYRLFVPERAATATDQTYPIILALHSGRGRANDNIKQIDHTIEILISGLVQDIEPAYVLAPQADEWTHWVDYDSFSPPFLNFSQQEIPQSDNLKTAIQLLRHIIDSYGIDRERVYITGISMGGEGTWDALTYYPELFAAAIPLNGAGDPEALPRIERMPIRFFHGSADTITPVENSRALNQALRNFPNNAVYTELPNAGHDIRDLVYTKELFEWLFAQRRES